MFITDAQISFTILDCLKKDHKDCKRADHLEHPISTRNFTQTYERTVGHGYYICTLRILDRSWRRFIMSDQCFVADGWAGAHPRPLSLQLRSGVPKVHLLTFLLMHNRLTNTRTDHSLLKIP